MAKFSIHMPKPESYEDILTARAYLSAFDPKQDLSSINVSAFQFSGNPSPPQHVLPGRQTMVKVGSIVLASLAISSTAVGLIIRLCSKQRKWSTHDFFVALATCAVVAFDGVTYYGVCKADYGGHRWDLTWSALRWNYDLTNVMFLTFFTSSGLTKIAIVTFIREVIGDKLRHFRRFTSFVLALLWAYTLLAIFWIVFHCGPQPRFVFDTLWSAQQNAPYHCLDIANINLILTILHAILDFIVLFISLYLYWRIRSTWTRKLSLIALFGLGISSLALSTVRMVLQTAKSLTADWTFELGYVLLLAMLDVTTALFVANTPVIYNAFFTKAQDWHEAHNKRKEQKQASRKLAWQRSLYVREVESTDSESHRSV